MHYKHEQIGYFMIAAFALAELAVFFGLSTVGSVAFISVSCIILVSTLLFYSLTVEIKEDFVDIRFGIGLIKKKFKLADILSANTVMNKWYYGWGIRMLENGWLYNVSGLDAVEIKLKSGKVYRIGTDEPEKLKTAITVNI